MKGDAPEKKLACSFIPKFFKHFPKLADQAIDAQLDLCEDEDPMVSLTNNPTVRLPGQTTILISLKCDFNLLIFSSKEGDLF